MRQLGFVYLVLFSLTVLNTNVNAQAGWSGFWPENLPLHLRGQMRTQTIEGKAQPMLEAYGDSVTAGMLSSTDLTHVDSLSSVGQIMADFLSFARFGDMSYLTRHESRDLAWPSLLARELARDGRAYAVENLSFSGAETSEVIKQVRGGADSAPEGTLAFFFIGHNDLCYSPYDPETEGRVYHDELNKALRVWDAKHQGAIAYLLPMGDVNRVYSTLSGYVWYRTAQHSFTCNESWSYRFPYCRNYSKLFQQGKLDDFLAPRIAAMNEQLGVLADQWNQQSTRGNRYLYVRGVTKGEYEPSFFAVDCYHLSQFGQETYAKAIYANIEH